MRWKRGVAIAVALTLWGSTPSAPYAAQAVSAAFPTGAAVTTTRLTITERPANAATASPSVSPATGSTPEPATSSATGPVRPVATVSLATETSGAAARTVTPTPTETPGAPEGTDGTPANTPAAIATAAETVWRADLAAVFRKYHTLGAVVCVIQNGAVAYTACYGARDLDGAPMTADTLFRVGSISKMVTGIGLMRLAEEGRLSLDADLSPLLGVPLRHPRYPDTAVTLRQLMTHTAALRDSDAYDRALAGEVTPLSQLFTGKLLPEQFLSYTKPGTRSRYSNFGGGLLGCVLEAASGTTVDAWMQAEVFAPLGLTAAYQSALLPADAPVSDQYQMLGRTLGEAVRDGAAAVTEPDPQTHYTWTAGKLTLSAPDLSRLLVTLCDGGVCGGKRILREDSVLAMRMLQNGIGSVTGRSNRGLCLIPQENTLVRGRTLWGHGGKANGMLCAAYFDPTDRTGVVMLTNGCDRRATYGSVGALTVAVTRLCYTLLAQADAVRAEPWLVES